MSEIAITDIVPYRTIELDYDARRQSKTDPTFSVESQYAKGRDRAKAGHWQGETFIPARGKQ